MAVDLDFRTVFSLFSSQNERGQCPADAVPEPLDMPLEMADAAALAKELRTLLREALPRPCAPLPLTLPAPGPGSISDKAKAQLATMGLRLGDRVVIAGQKVLYVLGKREQRALYRQNICDGI